MGLFKTVFSLPIEFSPHAAKGRHFLFYTRVYRTTAHTEKQEKNAASRKRLPRKNDCILGFSEGGDQRVIFRVGNRNNRAVARVNIQTVIAAFQFQKMLHIGGLLGKITVFRVFVHQHHPSVRSRDVIHRTALYARRSE